MTKEEKQKDDREILLRDLSGRIPYGVKIAYDGNVEELYSISERGYWEVNDRIPLEKVKPYLRPISSITYEDRKNYKKSTDYEHLQCYDLRANNEDENLILEQDMFTAALDLDWMNKHHFDYNCLIVRGLALEAPEGMYN